MDRAPDLDLVGSAVDLPEPLALLAEREVDVVVTDIRMPPTGPDEGIQVAARLPTERAEVGVVVLRAARELTHWSWTRLSARPRDVRGRRFGSS